MATIILRKNKTSALTHDEMDDNLSNLNNLKLEVSDLSGYAPLSAATAIGTSNTPSGNISATNVQAAINELDTEKANAANPSTSGTLTHSGDILLSGSGKRITGDFSNATLAANRVMFQTNAVDSFTVVGVIPKGSGTSAHLSVFNSSDPDNASLGNWGVGTTDLRLVSTKVGTGSYLPMTFYTGGSERLRIDTAGNVGIGTSTPGKRLDVQAVAANAAIRLKETATYGVPWDIDVGSANAMRFTNGAGGLLSYEFYNGSVEVRSAALLGYGPGAGGTVTQATSKSTAVTLNKPSGKITTAADALAAGATVTFTCSNSLVTSNDSIVITHNWGVSTGLEYEIKATTYAGNIIFFVKNTSAGALSQAVVFNFAIIKGAVA